MVLQSKPTRKKADALVDASKKACGLQIHLEEQYQIFLKHIETSWQQRCEEFEKCFANVPETLRYIQKLEHSRNAVEAQSKIKKDWERMFQREGLPLTVDPCAIRKYIEKWQFEESETRQTAFDWLLCRDELSILSQSYKRQDKTLKNLGKLQNNISDRYALRTGNVLKVLRSIQGKLEDESQNVLQKIMLMEQGNNLKNILKNYLNQLTTEVLRNFEREMRPADTTSYEYMYDCEHFKMKIWALRDVPMPKMDDIDEIIIQCEKIGASLKFPTSHGLEQVAFRLLWTNYDHYSLQQSTEFQAQKQYTSFESYLREEYDRRAKIHKNVLIDLQSKKNQVLSNLEAHTTKSSNESKPSDKSKKGKSIKKPTRKARKKNVGEQKQIFNLGDLTMYDELLRLERYENEEIVQKREQLNNAMSLKKYDVNLRSHQILGGVFTIDYFCRNCRQRIFLQKQFKIVETTFEFRNDTDFTSKVQCLLCGTVAIPSIEIQVKLSPNLVWCNEPIVCSWLPFEEAKVVRENNDIGFKNNLSNRYNFSSTNTKRKNHSPDKFLPDFPINDMPKHIGMSYLFKNFVNPCLPFNFKVGVEQSLQKTPQLKENQSTSTESLRSFAYSSCLKVITNDPSLPRPAFVASRPQLKICFDMDGEKLKQGITDHKSNGLTKIQQEEPLMFSQFFGQIQKEYFNQKFPFCADVWQSNQSQFSLSSNEEETNNNNKKPSSRVFSAGFQSNQSFDMEKSGKWSTQSILYQKYDKNERTVSFKATRFGMFGIATFRYNHFPLRNWKLEPSPNNNQGVVLYLKTPFVQIEVSITTEGYSCKFPDFEPCQFKLDEKLSFRALKHGLRSIGIDVFPDEDAACYMLKPCEKQLALETHVYYCIAARSQHCIFARHEWNMYATHRKILLLVGPHHDESKEYREVLVTSTNCSLVQVQAEKPEATQSYSLKFSADPEERWHHSDLYLFLKKISNDKYIETENYLLLHYNIFRLLSSTRPLSFS